jgi:hypothetical protein
MAEVDSRPGKKNFANPATPGFNSEVSLKSGLTRIMGLGFRPELRSGRSFSTKTISTNGEARVVQLGVKFYF